MPRKFSTSTSAKKERAREKTNYSRKEKIVFDEKSRHNDPVHAKNGHSTRQFLTKMEKRELTAALAEEGISLIRYARQYYGNSSIRSQNEDDPFVLLARTYYTAQISAIKSASEEHQSNSNKTAQTATLSIHIDQSKRMEPTTKDFSNDTEQGNTHNIELNQKQSTNSPKNLEEVNIFDTNEKKVEHNIITTNTTNKEINIHFLIISAGSCLSSDATGNLTWEPMQNHNHTPPNSLSLLRMTWKFHNMIENKCTIQNCATLKFLSHCIIWGFVANRATASTWEEFQVVTTGIEGIETPCKIVSWRGVNLTNDKITIKKV